MTTHIFVNLPTNDLDRSKAFYEGLGYSINPLFTDENAACVVIAEHIQFMILRTDFLQTFTSKSIIDPATSAQALVALSAETREQVDTLAGAALDHGGSEPKQAQDYGFMYSRQVEDPDGNILEFLYMDPQAAEQGPEAFAADQGPEAHAAERA